MNKLNVKMNEADYLNMVKNEQYLLKKIERNKQKIELLEHQKSCLKSIIYLLATILIMIGLIWI